MSDAPAAEDKATAEAPKDEAKTEAPATAGDSKRPEMSIKIYSPFKVFFEGKGYSLTAVNAVGPFDVLPHHHNFLCLLVPCDVVIETSYGKETVRISQALMHVKAEKITVFVDV
jgi:F0F1-type ATP synthase epsilon subunit